jgi:hypothetical protein
MRDVHSYCAKTCWTSLEPRCSSHVPQRNLQGLGEWTVVVAAALRLLLQGRLPSS